MADIELPNHEELKEIQKDHFSKRVALATAVFAVFLAITSLGGNNATKEMMLGQQQSSNQWAYYQSKALRENLYKSQRIQTEAAYFEKKDSMKAEAKANYERIIKEMKEEELRYKSEKAAIEKEAKQLEKTRDINMAKDPYFDFAEVFLQIAIVMSSISILAGSRPVFIVSCISAFMGIFLMFDGYLLFYALPFFK